MFLLGSFFFVIVWDMEADVENIFLLFVAGAVGSLVSQLVRDNTLELPAKVTSGLCLGFLGGLVVGGFVGVVVDGSYVSAGLAGYVGVNVIEKFLPDISVEKINKKYEEEYKK